MSDTVLKRLNVSDVFTIPYEANKLWSIPSSSFENDGIFFQIGTYTDSQVKTSYTGDFSPRQHLYVYSLPGT